VDARAGAFLELAQEKYRNNPIAFAREVIGIDLTKQQSVALTALAESRKVAVKSGHGTGKSCVEAIGSLWFLTTRPMSRVVLTAPSARQLYDVLMAEVRMWYLNSILADFDLFRFTKDKIRINHEEYEDVWFATCVSVSNPENLSGMHAKDILAIVDEGAGVDSEIFVRLEGVLTTEGAYMVTCGNPSFQSGYFYDIFHEYAEQYSLFTFNCEESENVEQEWIDYMAEKYGKDSNIYKVRVLGEFAPMHESIIIDRDALKLCYEREGLEDRSVVYLGIDVSSGESNDLSVISARSGTKELRREKYKLKIKDFFRKTMSIINEYSYHYRSVVVNIDTTGLGFQIGQDLEEAYYYDDTVEINRINFSNRAVRNEEYGNVFTEMIFGFKEKMDTIELYNGLEDSVLDEDLSARRFTFDFSNRFLAEKKKEIIKRIKRSPDEGDAVLLAFYEESEGAEITERFVVEGGW